jgi:TrmH family RNA methyltransferase
VTAADLFPALGKHNPRLKEVRRLRSPQDRRQEGLFLAEGVRVLEEAAAAGHPLDLVLVSARLGPGRALDLARRLAGQGAEVRAVDPETLERLAPSESSQGLLALARSPAWQISSVVAGDLVLWLDGVADPGNAGTLIRTAWAAGAGGVLASRGVDPFSPKTVRASGGALFRLPVLGVEPGAAREALAASGHLLAAAEAAGGASLFQTPLPRRLALLLGGEARGVAPELSRVAALRLTIPMRPQCESLNVAVAGALVLYEHFRQHRPFQGKP